MKRTEKKIRKNARIDLTAKPLPFRRAPELDGKVQFPPEKAAQCESWLSKFGLPPYKD
jgi:hypothetical protein